MNNTEKGHYYERMAAKHLSRMGYRILERNYRCRQAEIDLIAMDGAYLVFVEVKYRQNHAAQHPLAAVDERKQRQISRAAMQYLYSHGYGEDQPCRFDVAAIEGDTITICRDAFSYRL